ncbi:insulinase family protein [Guyparkeria halophila]|uniref:Insulinase family protein n=1 Tax=Guyparkeria halophila TaxID=47960 RepID=A0ABZ0YYB4_9GAMM|nr:insulinase family protein [Guyparkeria halophila]WQH17018.1 insulinase family protein [Guyparkeria halophila]
MSEANGSHAKGHHPAFSLVRSVPIEALNLTVDEYRHDKTGARHYHLATDDDQNVFLVGLRTVPEDSTGVAHILEHTALCGSERFPVRDPFFMMIRRSLNTFMNAFTSSDWTAYPFASCNEKDYYNLLDVYLDATFFSRIDELDFRQEGHRVEFEQWDDPSTPLTFKGVVFNEMKGAMSDPTSVLWQTLSRELFPDTTYHHNSGGDPERIPDLTYEQMVAFYKRFYHPSNAVFMTYGNQPVERLQTEFEERALARFDEIDPDSAVPLQSIFAGPKQVEDIYPLDDEDTSEKTHVNIGWMLDESADLDARLEAQLLEGVLLENSASPLLRALETTDLGAAPSPVLGLEDSQRQMVFVAGLEGSEADRAEAVEKLVLDTLTEVADKGVDPDMVESVLHQLELEQREVTGDGFPYGLHLIVQALPAAIHDSDPINLLDLEPALERLRAKAADPQFIPNLVRRLLLDNPHRVRLVLKPDTELSARQLAAEKARLAAMQDTLTADDKQRIVDQAKALADRQAEEGDLSLLPTVTREDIPEDIDIPQPEQFVHQPSSQRWYNRSTNGLCYLQLAIDLPHLDRDELELMPVYTSLLTELGAGDRDYVAMAEAVTAKTGGFSSGASVRAGIDDVHRTSGFWLLSGKALVRHADAMVDLFHQHLDAARFDEIDRIRDLVSQMRFGTEQGVSGRGHVHAMMLASSGMSARAAMRHDTAGVSAVRRIKAMDDGLEQAESRYDLAERLARLHEKLKGGLRHYNVVTEQRHFAEMAQALRPHMHQGQTDQPFALGHHEARVREAWIGNLAVNYCAKAHACVPPKHPDAAALAVLGGFMRNGFLHTAIREKGGAYGGGAGFDAESGSFRFFSYRDPRLAETLDDFDRAVDWVVDNTHEDRTVEEAIFGVIASIDKPGSPAGEAKKAFMDTLHGRTPDDLREIRARVLDVTQDDLKRVAETYLKPETASVGVLAGPSREEDLKALDLRIERI